MRFFKNLYSEYTKTAWMGVFIAFFLTKNAYTQANINQVPTKQEFRTDTQILKVSNVRYDETYTELNCQWETSHAEISGLEDTEAQNYLNDWLSSMTFFGNCESDNVCFDYQSFHYYYKITQVRFIQNNIASVSLREGNCEKTDSNCCENQDWEVYDLEKKRFLVEADFFRQEVVARHALNKLIEQKVHLAGFQLHPNWKNFTLQFGIENQQVIIYLFDKMVNNPYGLILRFNQDQIEWYLQTNYAHKIWSKFASIN
jgi:hypothetical protein